MKQLLKPFLIVLVLILVTITVFFFWASSPLLEESEYEKLYETSYKTKIDNDSIYSIVTYNIGYLSGMTNNKAIEKPKELFQKNMEIVQRELADVNADIIAFQEIDYNSARSYEVNQEDEIAKLGYKYIAKGINWDETYGPFPYWPPSIHFGKMSSGQSILSKYQ